ncbi:MAG: ribbon-helix-helix protein, CopG family [Bryobacteraceae bacterium]
MVRTIISLEEPDKKWLDSKASQLGLPTAELVRRFVIRMRQEEESAYEKMLQQTSGIWEEGDGLEYQNRMRDEWT